GTRGEREDDIELAALLHRAAETALDVVGKFLRAHGMRQAPGQADRQRVARLHGAFHLQAKHIGETRVVAQLRMRIQRQVVGKQADVVTQQSLQALLLHAAYARILAFPEVTVVNEDGIGLLNHGGIDQRLAGGDATDHALDTVATLDLQAIGAVVAELLRLQQPVQCVEHRVALDHPCFPLVSELCRASTCAECRDIQKPRALLLNKCPRPARIRRVYTSLSRASLMKALRFFAWPIVAGVLVGLAVLWWYEAGPGAATGRLSGPFGGRIDSYAEAVSRAAPAVVNIYTTQVVTQDDLSGNPLLDRFERPRRERLLSSLGSGVLVSEKGYVLTSHHVIQGGDEIIVALEDGRDAMASIVGTD